MEYTFSKKAKTFSFILMAIGVIALIVGLITDESQHMNRFWTNIMVNGFFFFGISLGALFFFAIQYAADAGWSALLKRVFEATMSFLPIGGAIIILVLLVGTFHGHHMYHWMEEGIAKHDDIIAGKMGFLNLPFFWFRTLLYIATFVGFAWWFRKKSLEEDKVGGTKIHFQNKKMAVIFIILFAIFSSAMAWDWIMSITPHWYSTLFGWYVLGGFWCSSMIVMVVLTLYLKKKGYLPQVNENHIHDLGKWLFALSFLWTYLWYSQFMLIWYGDKPEEATYFIQRIENYNFVFFAMLVVNFVLPMVFLMSRDAKRNYKTLLTIAIIIFFTHWLDTFILFMPGTVYEHWHMGFMEIGMALGFLGLFIFLTLRKLSKAPVTPAKHPFLEESVHIHT